MGYHKSVLLKEAVDSLLTDSNGLYVDGTAGGGGHSESIAHRLSGGRLLCIDRDMDAQAAAKERLKNFSNIIFVKDNFKNLKNILRANNIEKIDGILLDLGVSSHQLDTGERGFSYMKDAFLDMRMDRESGITAKDIIDSYSKDDLIRIFKEYGEEKNSKKIAEKIVETRKTSLINTTGDLVKIIDSVTKKNLPGGHPAKRVFQALRIEVNNELDDLYDFILSLPDMMNVNARICVITFHSLEDRIVKKAFKKLSDPCECPKEFPVCVCGKKPKGKIITRKPILPGEEEIKENSRAKSAKLRVFEVCKFER